MHDADLTTAERAELLDTAVDALESLLRTRVSHRARPDAEAPSARLLRHGASFVTLRDAGHDLLGCIGTIEAHRPLVDDVVANAVAAASRDPRFAPVRASDLAGGEVHISVLSAMSAMPVVDRADLLAQVRPHTDGLLIESGYNRGTFLPSVWEQIPDAEAFLDHLWHKAGLHPRTWPATLRVWRYTAIDLTRHLS